MEICLACPAMHDGKFFPLFHHPWLFYFILCAASYFILSTSSPSLHRYYRHAKAGWEGHYDLCLMLLPRLLRCAEGETLLLTNPSSSFCSLPTKFTGPILNHFKYGLQCWLSHWTLNIVAASLEIKDKSFAEGVFIIMDLWIFLAKDSSLELSSSNQTDPRWDWFDAYLLRYCFLVFHLSQLSNRFLEPLNTQLLLIVDKIPVCC